MINIEAKNNYSSNGTEGVLNAEEVNSIVGELQAIIKRYGVIDAFNSSQVADVIEKGSKAIFYKDTGTDNGIVLSRSFGAGQELIPDMGAVILKRTLTNTGNVTCTVGDKVNVPVMIDGADILPGWMKPGMYMLVYENANNRFDCIELLSNRDGDDTVPVKAGVASNANEVMPKSQVESYVADEISKVYGNELVVPRMVDGKVSLSNLESKVSYNAVEYSANTMCHEMYGGIRHNRVVPNNLRSATATHSAYPSVIELVDNTLEMYFTEYEASDNFYISKATSIDGIEWKYKGVVLSPGAAGSVSEMGPYMPVVLEHNGTWFMWHCVHDGSAVRINLHTSTDRITWTDQGVVIPLGVSGESDDYHTHGIAVFWDDSVSMFRAWYGANDSANWSTNYATSTDGINWTKAGPAVGINDIVTNGYPGSGNVMVENGILYFAHSTKLNTGPSQEYVIVYSKDNGSSWSVTNQPIREVYDGKDLLIDERACIVKRSNGKYCQFYTQVNGSYRDIGVVISDTLPEIFDIDADDTASKLQPGEWYSKGKATFVNTGVKAKNISFFYSRTYTNEKNNNLAFFRNGMRLMKYINANASDIGYGPELAPNPNLSFTNGVLDVWVPTAGVTVKEYPSTSTCIMETPANSPTGEGIGTDIDFEIGGEYEIRIRVGTDTAYFARYAVIDDVHVSDGLATDKGDNTEVSVQRFIATAATHNVKIVAGTSAATSIALRDINIRKIINVEGFGPELLPNQYFSNTDNLIPGNGASLSVGLNRLVVTNGTDYGYVRETVDMEAGKIYLMSGVCWDTSPNWFLSGRGGVGRASIYEHGTGSAMEVIKCTETGTYDLYMQVNTVTDNVTATFTSMSIKEMLPTHWEDLTPVENGTYSEELDWDSARFQIQSLTGVDNVRLTDTLTLDIDRQWLNNDVAGSSFIFGIIDAPLDGSSVLKLRYLSGSVNYTNWYHIVRAWSFNKVRIVRSNQGGLGLSVYDEQSGRGLILREGVGLDNDTFPTFLTTPGEIAVTTKSLSDSNGFRYHNSLLKDRTEILYEDIPDALYTATTWLGTSVKYDRIIFDENSNVNTIGNNYLTFYEKESDICKFKRYVGSGNAREMFDGFDWNICHLLVKNLTENGEWYAMDFIKNSIYKGNLITTNNTSSELTGDSNEYVQKKNNGFMVYIQGNGINKKDNEYIIKVYRDVYKNKAFLDYPTNATALQVGVNKMVFRENDGSNNKKMTDGVLNNIDLQLLTNSDLLGV